MIFFFDENLPPQLAHALQILESPHSSIQVKSIKNYFGPGTADKDWIPPVGQMNGFALTEDHNIHKNKYERQLAHQHGLGLFILKPPSKRGYSYWEKVEKIITEWPRIKEKARQIQQPFTYVIRPNSFKKLH